MNKVTNAYLENFRAAGNQYITVFSEGMSRLHQSMVFHILRDNGRVRIPAHTIENYTEVTAAQAQWSAGYNQALDDLMGFKERFLDLPKDQRALVEMDFGGVRRAIREGLITQEEADGKL